MPRSFVKLNPVSLSKVINVIEDTLQRPWWKEPMLWLVAGLPAIVVVASFITYFIAANNPDPLVNAGYQKVGMAPGKDMSRERRALSLQIGGELVMLDGTANLKLSGRLDTMPAQLELLLLHPTHADQDVRVQLREIGNGEYVGSMPMMLQGNWQWILEPIDGAWRLAGGLTLPLDGGLKLGSKEFNNHP